MPERAIVHTPGGNWWGHNGDTEEAVGPYTTRKDLVQALDGQEPDDETDEEADAILSGL